MNFFDKNIILFFNQFSQQSWLLDRAINFIAGNDLFKGGLFMAVIWWLWFNRDQGGQTRKNRETLLATLGGVCISLVVARSLALVLPFRERPMAVAELAFKVPAGLDAVYVNWSSFPSDHAAMFATLATGLWLISTRLGLAAMIYVVLVISLPRFYVGLHYPTDIMAGLFLGVGTILLMARLKPVHNLAGRILDWSESEKNQGLFYALFFIITFQMAVLFDSVRHFGSAVKHIIVGH